MKTASPFFASILLAFSLFSSVQPLPAGRIGHPDGSAPRHAVANGSDTAELPDEKVFLPAFSLFHSAR